MSVKYNVVERGKLGDPEAPKTNNPGRFLFLDCLFHICYSFTVTRFRPPCLLWYISPSARSIRELSVSFS